MLRASKRVSSCPVLQSTSDIILFGTARGSKSGKVFFHATPPRFQYNYGSESSGSGAGTLLKVVGVTGVILGMPLAYAAYDAKFKTTLEGYAPFLKPVLEKIAPSPPPTSNVKLESAKPKFDPPSSPLSFSPPKTPPKVEKHSVVPPKTEVKDVTEKKGPTSADSDLLVGKDSVIKAPSSPLKSGEKPSNVSGSGGITADKASQVRPDTIAESADKSVEVKPKPVAPVTTKDLDNKSKLLEKTEGVSPERVMAYQGFPDLSALLKGRRLSADEERLVETVIDSTVDRLHAEFDEYIEDLESEHEWELQMQLKRQILAHAETVIDALKRQEGELEAHFQARWQRWLDEERQRFNLQVASGLARVQGIEEAVHARSRKERINQKAQYLWHASHALYDAVTYGNLAGHTAEERLVPLSRYVTMAKIFSDSHPFVLSILRAVPEEALVRGVFTEEALRDRFNGVKHSARRVAMISDHNHSLYRYFLSYLQSLLIRDRPYDFSVKQELDAASLDTFRVLATAHKFVQQGDLATAVRLVGQLKGESRKVAQDWLKETRLHLETRQISKLLLAHASAVGLSNVPVDQGK